MIKNYLYGIVAFLIGFLFLIGKVYAQSTYPAIAKTDPAPNTSQVTAVSDNIKYDNTTNIWKRR